MFHILACVVILDIIALYMDENIVGHGCEGIVEIDTVLGVRWCVVSTRLWINTAYGVD